MINFKIKNVLEKYGTAAPSPEWGSLKQLTTDLQSAELETIVFYRVKDQKRAGLFLQRLSGVDPGLIVTTGEKISCDKPHIHLQENDFLKLQFELSDILYPLDFSEMKISGVTGTNGKTSVVHLARELAASSGKYAASIGTMGVVDSKTGELMNLGSTSPSYVDLRRILSFLQKKSVDCVFIEVSSHALDQNRLGQGELLFDSAAWTNFTQDHLDYHDGMDDYLRAKKKIFKLLRPGKKLLVHHEEQVLLSKLAGEPAIEEIESLNAGELGDSFQGGFPKKNLELAVSLLEKCYPDLEIKGMEKVQSPRGRFSVLDYEKRKVVIDYAHTPDALENVCRQIKSSFQGELIIVFGCGGDRDPGKRPLMGKIAEKYGDIVIVTSDNPRSENPGKIIEDIVKGFSKETFTYIDRREAIERALNLSEGKILLIAGKGHETYQEIKGLKNYFSDFEVVEELMERIND